MTKAKAVLIVDVYHSGPRDKPEAPFLFMVATTKGTPAHPGGRKWFFWKTVPLNHIAVAPSRAEADLHRFGFSVQ